MIPKKIYLNEAEFDDLFTSERMVSCDEPYSDLTVEFTNLSKVWHTPDEEPEEERPMVAIDKKGVAFSGVYRPFYRGYTPRYAGVYWNAGGCFSGSVLIYWEDVVKWAYIEYLLPNNITNN